MTNKGIAKFLEKIKKKVSENETEKANALIAEIENSKSDSHKMLGLALNPLYPYPSNVGKTLLINSSSSLQQLLKNNA